MPVYTGYDDLSTEGQQMADSLALNQQFRDFAEDTFWDAISKFDGSGTTGLVRFALDDQTYVEAQRELRANAEGVPTAVVITSTVLSIAITIEQTAAAIGTVVSDQTKKSHISIIMRHTQSYLIGLERNSLLLNCVSLAYVVTCILIISAN